MGGGGGGWKRLLGLVVVVAVLFRAVLATRLVGALARGSFETVPIFCNRVPPPACSGLGLARPCEADRRAVAVVFMGASFFWLSCGGFGFLGGIQKERR